MTTFQENLAGLPGIEGIARIELLDGDTLVTTIENQAGSQGSLRVYRHLQGKFGGISPAAAEEGLMLYAEHTEDARSHPGKHPNIDRLLELVRLQHSLAARVIQA